MANIEWVKNKDGSKGTTWNAVTGCSKISAGCKNCYAKRIAETKLRGKFGYPEDEPFRVTIHHDKIDDPRSWKKGRKVFVCSMSDIFHDDIPQLDRLDIFNVMSDTPQHTYQILTKRADKIAHYFPWSVHNPPPQNIWMGVTTEDQDGLDVRSLYLPRTGAAVKFISIEPILEEINLDSALKIIDWVIVGKETGPNARLADARWIIKIVDQCKKAGVPVFVKGAPAGLPNKYMVREFPNVKT